MGDVVSLQERQRKKAVDAIVESIGGMYEAADKHASEFFDLAMREPLQAVERLPQYIKRARDINPPGIEAMAGGPNHDWVAPMINVLGAVYPLLPREARESGLRKVLNYLDSLNYFYSQNHVELIDDPWLVGDIQINRHLYWPGYTQTTHLLEQHPSWVEFRNHMHEVRSDFFRTFPIILIKYASLDVRAGFAEDFPVLIDRTLDAIAAIVWEGSKKLSKQENLEFDAYLDNYLNDFDPVYHQCIRLKMEERKWIKFSERES